MPLYTAFSVDVWGNPIDGWEVNAQRELGEIYISTVDEAWRGYADAFDQYLVQRLVDRGWLKAGTADLVADGEIFVEDDADGNCVVRSRVTAFAAVEEDQATIEEGGSGRFISMVEAPHTAAQFDRARQNAAQDLNQGQTLEEVLGDYPLIELEPQMLTFDQAGSCVFWTQSRKNLKISAEFDEGRIGFVVNTHGQIDRFEWDFAEWRERPRFGFDPITSKELPAPTKAQLAEVFVAMDKYLETR